MKLNKIYLRSLKIGFLTLSNYGYMKNSGLNDDENLTNRNNHKHMCLIGRRKLNTTIKAYEKYLKNKSSNKLPKYLWKEGNNYSGIPLN